LKSDKNSTSSEDKRKKKGGISFEVDGNYDIKKPKLSGKLKIPVLDADRTKIQILPSIDKSNVPLAFE
jgi:hypothetical protein